MKKNFKTESTAAAVCVESVKAAESTAAAVMSADFIAEITAAVNAAYTAAVDNIAADTAAAESAKAAAAADTARRNAAFNTLDRTAKNTAIFARLSAALLSAPIDGYKLENSNCKGENATTFHYDLVTDGGVSVKKTQILIKVSNGSKSLLMRVNPSHYADIINTARYTVSLFDGSEKSRAAVVNTVLHDIGAADSTAETAAETIMHGKAAIDSYAETARKNAAFLFNTADVLTESRYDSRVNLAIEKRETESPNDYVTRVVAVALDITAQRLKLNRYTAKTPRSPKMSAEQTAAAVACAFD